MPFILSRYSFKEILWPSLLALAALTFMLVVSRLYDLIDFVLHPGVTFAELAGIIGPMVPSIIVFAAPMALLVGVQIGIGRMVMDREVLAMRTSGVNLLKVFMPAVIGGLLVSFVVLQLSQAYVPAMIQRGIVGIAELQFKMIKELEPGRVHDTLPKAAGGNVDLYYNSRDEKTGDMLGVVIKITRPAFTPAEVTAIAEKTGRPVRADEDILLIAKRGGFQAGGDATKGAGMLTLSLTDGVIHRLDPDPVREQYTITKFDTFAKQLSMSEKVELPNKTLTKTQIGAEISRQEALIKEGSPNAQGRINKLRRELSERFSIAWAAFAFMLVGVPLALMVRVSGKSLSILVAITLMVVYYVSMKFGLAMVEKGRGHGEFVAFMPNIAYAVLGAGLWWRVLRT